MRWCGGKREKISHGKYQEYEKYKMNYRLVFISKRRIR